MNANQSSPAETVSSERLLAELDEQIATHRCEGKRLSKESHPVALHELGWATGLEDAKKRILSANSWMVPFSLLVGLLVACATTASIERGAYITVGSATTAVELARQGYINHANECLCVQSNEFLRVQNAYEEYQRGAELAGQLIVAYKQSTTPNPMTLESALTALSDNSSNLVTMIIELLPGKDGAKVQRQIGKVKP